MTKTPAKTPAKTLTYRRPRVSEYEHGLLGMLFWRLVGEALARRRTARRSRLFITNPSLFR